MSLPRLVVYVNTKSVWPSLVVYVITKSVWPSLVVYVIAKFSCLCYYMYKECLTKFGCLCYYRECLTKFGDSIGNQLWEAINDCFDVMPVAATVDDRVSPILPYSKTC